MTFLLPREEQNRPARWRRPAPLTITAWSLMTNTVINAGLGVVFWAVAGRLYSPASLGKAAALISAMVLLSTIAQLNLATGITRLLPQVTHHRWRPILGVYAATGLVAVVLTTGFVTLAPAVSDGFDFLRGNLPLAIALIGAVVLWNIFALQDAVLTSARWSALVPLENAAFGVIKILLLFSLVGGPLREGVFYAWLIAMVVMLIPVNAVIFGRVLRGGDNGALAEAQVLPISDRSRVVRYLAGDYAAALLSQGGKALLPLLVVAVLGREPNAYFYVAFLVAAGLGAVADALSTSLLAEASYLGSDVQDLARRSAGRYLKFVLPAGLALIGLAPWVLFPFGPAYVENGTVLLRLLLGGVLIHAVVTLYFAIARVLGQVARILWGEVALFLLVAGGGLIGLHLGGLIGLGVAYLLAQSTVALTVLPSTLALLGFSGRAAGRAGHSAPVSRNLDRVALFDLAAAGVSGGLMFVLALNLEGAVRVALAVTFVVLVPGWVVQRFMPMSTQAIAGGLSVVLSLTIAVLVTLVGLWTSTWHPRVMGEVIAAVCLAGSVWRLARPRPLSP